MNRLSADYLRQIINYNPESGVFTWRERRGRVSPGEKASCMDKHGYVVIRIDGHLYKSYRLAWLYMFNKWPDKEVDHLNGIRNDNRIANLREATHSENNQNVQLKKSNTSGYKGVSWSKSVGKWHAYSRVNGQRIHIGYFEDKNSAYFAACNFREQHHGEFANHG